MEQEKLNPEEKNKDLSSKKITKEGINRTKQLLRYVYPYRWPFIGSLISGFDS